MRLKIVADAHVWGVEDAFASFAGYDVDLNVLEAAHIDSHCLHDADVLISRSSVKINKTLLNDTKLRFVGTATVGDDHVDQGFLAAQGIEFASAAGSSTASVLEYMLSALLYMKQKKQWHWHEQTIGIIGVGRIGSAVASLAEQLGIHILLCDPPRMRQENLNTFVSMQEVLEGADILTIHTPLQHDGLDATWHLLNSKNIMCFQGHTLINAARGGVLSQDALLSWLNDSDDHGAILDCWEHEPNIAAQLLKHSGLLLGTAHIAGHSLDGKAANTYYVYQALCAHLGVEPSWQPDLVDVSSSFKHVDHQMRYQDVMHCYDIEQDFVQLRRCAMLSSTQLADQFKKIRRHYPVRRSWLTW
ncbi:MAG: 4-phosphoerythronate dehydrogenase [Mariprofundaceae bacterium]|nr:4-phosphoerythronate dehydrogenase [Mariprofundaceae bacterium]